VAAVLALLGGAALWWRSRRQAATRFDGRVDAVARQGRQLVTELRAARSGPLPADVAAATALDAESRARTLATDADDLARQATEERAPALRSVSASASALAGALGSERTVRVGPQAPTQEQLAYARALTDTRSADLERALQTLSGDEPWPPPAGAPPQDPGSGTWQPPTAKGPQPG